MNFIKNWIVRKKRNAIGHVKINGQLTWLVEKKVDEFKLHKKDILPKRWLFQKTKVKEIGVVDAHANLQRQVAPLNGNWVGTLGAVFKRRRSHNVFFSPNAFDFFLSRGVITGVIEDVILTNKHVVSQDMKTVVGDNVFVQPHGQRVAFKVVQLSKKYDAALLTPISQIGADWVKTQSFNPKYQQVKVGDEVVKNGRTTSITEGLCTAKGATIYINYGSIGKLRVDNCELFVNPKNNTSMSASGDSGSVIFLKEPRETAVSLLFAGSEFVTIGLPIVPIMEEFNIFN